MIALTLAAWDDAADAVCRSALEALADPGYRAFHSRLVPGIGPFLGVRVPDLRRMAREIVKGDFCGFLARPAGDLYERKMLYGMVLAMAPLPLEERLESLVRFIPAIDNWAICDTVAGCCKFAARQPEAVWDFLSPYFAAEETYPLRFAVVMLLDYFMTPEFLPRVLEVYGNVRHDNYYVKMAVAWGVSICFVKDRDRTLAFLEAGGLPDDFTHNKAIAKACDSLRVSAEDKALLRRLRRKQNR